MEVAELWVIRQTGTISECRYRWLESPATTFVITHSPSRSNRRDGLRFSSMAGGRTNLARVRSGLPNASPGIEKERFPMSVPRVEFPPLAGQGLHVDITCAERLAASGACAKHLGNWRRPALIDIKPRRGTAIAGITRDVKAVEDRYKAARGRR